MQQAGGQLVLHILPVGDTEPGPLSEAGQRMGEGGGKPSAQAPTCQEEDHLLLRSQVGLGFCETDSEPEGA